jgi:hypothetical protein
MVYQLKEKELDFPINVIDIQLKHDFLKVLVVEMVPKVI